jgi:lysophospholipid acyltransferase (LPLAT)-like uncharacterized protein
VTSSKKRKPGLLSRLFYSKPLLFFFGRLIKTGLSFLFATLRTELKGKEFLLELIEKRSSPLIIAFWHDQIVLAPLLAKIVPHRFCIVVSNSRDGHLLASFGKSYPNVSVIAVSHNKRHEALRQICDVLEKKEDIVLITPDGPRGPRHQVKPGIIYSAKKSNAKIIGMRWEGAKVWRLSSWDKMAFPKPFSKVTITFEKPFECCEEASIESLQEGIGKLL